MSSNKVPFTLEETAELMSSPDYQDRFLAEYHQLRIRTDRLKEMLGKWDQHNLSFTPTCPRSIYDLQVEYMEKYLAILEARGKMEDTL